MHGCVTRCHMAVSMDWYLETGSECLAIRMCTWTVPCQMVYHACRYVYSGAHNPKGRSVKRVIPPVGEWHLPENSIYGMPGGYAWLVYYATTASEL